jgi:predicted PurR-regulated permease PerM
MARTSAAARRAGVLRVRPRSIALLVALLGLTLVAVRVVAAAERVIGWMLIAAAVAGLAHPLVEAMGRRVPRGLAVVGSTLLAVVILGAIGYAVVDDVSAATTRLQRAAPDAAEDIEQSERLGELARTVELTERTEAFVADVPARLRGGSTADALRSNATRGVSFLTTTVLTIFLMLHGPRIARSAFDQLPDEARRERWAALAATAYRRGFGYARGTVGMALLTGGAGYLLALGLDVPGAAALAVWGALWDVVPILGAVVGALPIVVLAAVASPVKGLVAAVLVVVYQAFENVVLQRRLEGRTLRLGPFITVVAGLAGLEVRGATGALLGVLLAALAAAVLAELGADDAGEAAAA